MKALTWIVGALLALALLRMAAQLALAVFALAMLVAFVRAPKDTLAVIVGLTLWGLAASRPEVGLALFALVLLVTRPWRK